MADRDSCLSLEVDTVVTCPICLETFTNPRSLPCLHTFCLHCLKGCCRDKTPGDDAACPSCRQDFRIPPKGLDGLPHNFHMQRLVDVKQASCGPLQQREEPCALCSEEKEDPVPPATVYCLECDRKLCDRCSRLIHRMSRTQPHNILPVDADIEAAKARVRNMYCEAHADRLVEDFCFDCKTNICLLCSATKHRQHRRQEIKEVAQEFLRQIDEALQPALELADDARKQQEQLSDEILRFFSEIGDVEKEVKKKGEKQKCEIDRQVSELMAELQATKSETLKQLEDRKGQLEISRSAVERFRIYCTELKENHRPSDVTREAYNIHSRVRELLDNKSPPSGTVSVPHIQFLPADTDTNIQQNLIGAFRISSDSGWSLLLSMNVVNLIN